MGIKSQLTSKEIFGAHESISLGGESRIELEFLRTIPDRDQIHHCRVPRQEKQNLPLALPDKVNLGEEK